MKDIQRYHGGMMENMGHKSGAGLDKAGQNDENVDELNFCDLDVLRNVLAQKNKKR